jgi:hypothetical protein
MTMTRDNIIKTAQLSAGIYSNLQFCLRTAEDYNSWKDNQGIGEVELHEQCADLALMVQEIIGDKVIEYYDTIDNLSELLVSSYPVKQSDAEQAIVWEGQSSLEKVG